MLIMQNSSSQNIIFCQARVPHGNQGDLVLTKILTSELRRYGKLIINDLQVPEWYCKQLDMKDEERASSYPLGFSLLVWLYGLQYLFKSDANVYLILRPGHFYGSGSKLEIKMLLASLFYSILAIFQVKICRFGTSIESLSKPLQIAEKLRSIPMQFYSVRDNLSKDYALKIGIDKVKIFPDLAWLLPKEYVKENSQFLMQVPNSNEQPIKIDQSYIVLSFRSGFREFDSSGYKANLLTVLDKLVKMTCGDSQNKLVISYQVNSDYKFSKNLFERYQNEYDVLFIERYIDSRSMYDLYSGASMVCSNRLHVLMFAMFCGSLPIAIVNRDKERRINGIFSDAGLQEIILDISQGTDELERLPELLNRSQVIKEKISLAFQQNSLTCQKILETLFDKS
jgi:polysaccharide pyruvyl transferase WcaK-like protein